MPGNSVRPYICRITTIQSAKTQYCHYVCDLYPLRKSLDLPLGRKERAWESEDKPKVYLILIGRYDFGVVPHIHPVLIYNEKD